MVELDNDHLFSSENTYNLLAGNALIECGNQADAARAEVMKALDSMLPKLISQTDESCFKKVISILDHSKARESKSAGKKYSFRIDCRGSEYVDFE